MNENKLDYETTKKKKGGDYVIEENPQAIAEGLAKNELCLRHFGRAEVGPRALGHRSFLMSPLEAPNGEKVSVEVKQREWYRPVAPVMLEEDLLLYFTGGPARSPYMLFSYQAKKEAAEKLPAVIHFDGTSRVQTLNQKDDPALYEILSEFKKLTGVGALINSSLNLKGQPLANFLHDTFEIARRVHVKSFIAPKYE